MVNLAEGIADVVAGVGTLIGKFKGLGNVPFVNELLFGPVATRATKLLGSLGATSRPAKELPFNQQRSAGRISAKQFQTEDRLAKAKAAELATLQKKNAIENKSVEELKKKFDLERIGINAALNNATDEETKLRLKSQLAILDNNEALAKKLLAELEAAEALRKLAEQAKLAGMSLEDFGIFKVKTLSNKIDTFIEEFAISAIRELNARIAATMAKINLAIPSMTAAPAPASPYASYTVPQAIEKVQETNTRIQDFLSGFPGFSTQRSSTQEPMDIRLTIDGGSDKLSQAIAESIQVATRSGYSTVPAGFLV
jgi:hypothetical protein